MGHNTTSCLSAEDHHNAITDHLIHYFGCLSITERKEFRTDEHKVWVAECEHQRQLATKRGILKTPDKIETEAKTKTDAIRKRWISDFDKEEERIELLRRTLEKNNLTQEVDTWRKTLGGCCLVQEVDMCPRTPETANLVQEVDKCREAWRNSSEYRLSSAKPPKPDQTSTEPNPDPRNYIPEEDVSVGVIRFKDGKPFDKGSDLLGKFPNQKTNVQSLLYKGHTDKPEENLLHKDRIGSDSTEIRYFHIPSNNMMKAISRYFGEEPPKFDSFKRQLGRQDTAKTSIILQDRYWRGQFHGDEGCPPHARYMSPMCETILSSKRAMEIEPNNLVLFMPYLHWETSKKRLYFASEMDGIVAMKSAKKKEKEKSDKIARIDKRKSPNAQNGVPAPEQSATKGNTWLGTKFRTMTGLGPKTPKIDLRNEEVTKDNFISRVASAILQRPRFKIKSPLAKYLMAASKLYEEMTNYRDKMLLHKYLPENPPLHPRRTLDQAFYSTLQTTKERDCDQVVFRGTTAKPEDFHYYDFEAEKWAAHDEYDIKHPCPECTVNIQKLSRVVMVDQLWMWILDANTIITCFPKRYGANKNDASGIHKSIRSRVDEIGDIHTVFELGLIILDECSKTFFNRTKTLDRRPQVINEFSRAIGNIMHQQTVAFNRLWWWTEQAKLLYGAEGYTDTSNLHMTLLDIHPEGQLAKEIEDVIEELDIMLHLANTHDDILKKYIEQVVQILDPDDEFKTQKGVIKQKKPEANTSLSNAEMERKKAYQCFKQKANEGQARAGDCIKELKDLRESAKKTGQDVQNLLQMKQQQASVFQAWQAMKQSDETMKQGRSIMTFTLITIVFLPLSFLSSLFGMNNKEFGDNAWSVSQQILYIFTISAGVVFLSLLFAFSDRTRAFIWSHYVRFSTAAAVRLRIYDIYLERPTERIYDEAASKIYRVKNERRKVYFAQKGFKRGELEREEREREEQEERGREEEQNGGISAGKQPEKQNKRSWGIRNRGVGNKMERGAPPGDLENGVLDTKGTN
ncbi:putative ankyrin repeat protein [Rosellinia necatrix]|uniref:Putative ankyrin repeat protein n=1 Tax=Rosellinia necatrix TaxID=77044 RepID=A0A1S7UIF3_ROSNE|nr:putative ankyrin repeat protein [Rosellinia necatrix]